MSLHIYVSSYYTLIATISFQSLYGKSIRIVLLTNSHISVIPRARVRTYLCLCCYTVSAYSHSETFFHFSRFPFLAPLIQFCVFISTCDIYQVYSGYERAQYMCTHRILRFYGLIYAGRTIKFNTANSLAISSSSIQYVKASSKKKRN